MATKTSIHKPAGSAPGQPVALSLAERYAAGKALRDQVPRARHGEWKAHRNRPNSVELVTASSKGRIAELIPLRHGRMSASPFAFYRGSALNMAADLAGTPITGIRTQVCGDCHLMNFGCFATPERRAIFDINDFDETLPGPWEWDIKRLVTSFVLAARSNGFPVGVQDEAATTCTRSYRERMAEYSRMRALDVWYARIGKAAVLNSLTDSNTAARLRKRMAKAASATTVETGFPKMVESSDGRFAIKDNAPLIYHHQSINLSSGRDNILGAFGTYRKTLPDDRRRLLDRYRLVDFALKVVGIGSVGTFCAVLLLMAEDDDPLFLQVKEARASALEPYIAKSVYPNHAQRVVIGQRLMQSASDIFLGWTHGQHGRHFYLRQMRDMKLKPLVEMFNRATMLDYAALCGWTLARAHARSGDAAMIAGYMGKGDVFDRAIARFARSYADQAERDHRTFMRAIRTGRIVAQSEQ